METNKNLAELRDEMRAVARGDRAAPDRPTEPLAAALSSEESVELMKILINERPESIGALARRVGRAQPNVSRSLQQLARLGLVRLTKEGREVRPEAVAREVRFDLTAGTYRTVPI